MPKAAKVAISLPEGLLREIEREREARGESRSEFFRRAAEALLLHEQEREAVERYVRGYTRHPETARELGWLEEASQAALAEYPWDDGDEA